MPVKLFSGHLLLFCLWLLLPFGPRLWAVLNWPGGLACVFKYLRNTAGGRRLLQRRCDSGNQNGQFRSFLNGNAYLTDAAENHTLTLNWPGGLNVFKYLHPDPDATLILHPDPDATLLITRGFHWISEEPFNR